MASEENATVTAMIGQVIGGRYKIVRKIGEGGMGEVYLAEHVFIVRKLALKLLRAEALRDEQTVARFRREARSASSIGHPNIITIDDFGALPDGREYMAMEFLEGQSLSALLARGPLPPARALDILIQVGNGLVAAHEKGITHRDLKPENVFVTEHEGRDLPKLLDFGIAKITGGDLTQQNLTVKDQIFGTPSYMAPEQALGASMDHRVDVYAMGIILYEVFCGEVPFKGENFMNVLAQHLGAEPAPPSETAARNQRLLPPGVEAIILRALRKAPEQRFQTMRELVAALVEVQRRLTVPHAVVPPRWPRWLLPGGGVAAAAIVLAVVRPWSPAPAPRPATVDAGGPEIPRVPDAPAPRVEVRITSSPPGADVLLASGQKLGVTPFRVGVYLGRPLEITLRLDDFQTASFVVDGTRLEIDQVLTHVDIKPPE